MSTESERCFDDHFAALLRGPKSALVNGDLITQPGWATIEIEAPIAWPELTCPDDEAVIVSFTVDADGRVDALSDAEPHSSAWKPMVKVMASTILGRLARHDVEVVVPAYVTASITPVDLLGGEPHLDDDHYLPGAGVGIGAVWGQHCGPRFKTGAILHSGRLDLTHLGQPLPLEVDKSLGPDPQQTGPDRIVAFTQFGQLHAGPTPTDMPVEARFRQLLVFRAATTPV